LLCALREHELKDWLAEVAASGKPGSAGRNPDGDSIAEQEILMGISAQG